eukprot:16247826-Heterocapsa_arctica.AAC.1
MCESVRSLFISSMPGTVISCKNGAPRAAWRSPQCGPSARGSSRPSGGRCPGCASRFPYR